MMKIKAAVSNRHVHLTKDTAVALGIDPKPDKWLGIGNNYASDTFVTAKNLKFRVLLPFRKYDQIEVLASDCKGLDIEQVYRNSGNLDGAPKLTVGGIDIPAIVALPHVHAPKAWQQGKTVVRIEGIKEIVLRDITVWPTDDCLEPILHIDVDEARAFTIRPDTEVHLETFIVAGTERGVTYSYYSPLFPMWIMNGRVVSPWSF